MMDVNDLISASVQLFNEEKYAEAIETLHQAWDGITDKSTRISEQCLIQTWLGRCYFEQAMKSKDTDSADKLFKKAIKHYRKWLRVIKADGQNDVQKQINALSWLGRCYLEQAMKSKDTDKADKLFGEAIKHYQEWLRLAKTYEQNSVQEQIYAQSWLGRCYLDQAMKSKDADKADKLLNKAVNHFQGALSLTEHLIDGQDRIRPKIYGQSGLGRCYLEQIKRNKSISEAEKFVKQAGEKFSAAYEQLSQLCKPPPPFALCYINFCTRSVLKVTAAFALYRMAEDKKSDVSVAFVLPVTNNQFPAGFTRLIPAYGISQFQLSNTEVLKQSPYIWVVVDG